MMGVTIVNFLSQIHFLMNNRILAVLIFGIRSFFPITAVVQFNFNLPQITHLASFFKLKTKINGNGSQK